MWLAGNALSPLAGTAVIEMEEARAIRRELELTGSDAVDRTVPFLVEGSSEVLGPSDGAAPKVRLDVRTVDGARQVELLRREIPLASVGAALADELPAAIARETGDGHNRTLSPSNCVSGPR